MNTTATAHYLISGANIDGDYAASDIARAINTHAIVENYSRHTVSDMTTVTVRFYSPKYEVEAHAERGLAAALRHGATDMQV